MVKKKKKLPRLISFLKFLGTAIGVVIIGVTLAVILQVYRFEKKYEGKIYPGVFIDGISFGGKTQKDVQDFFIQKNKPLKNIGVQLVFEDKIATASATDLSLAFDGELSAAQAFSIGRSGHLKADLLSQWKTFTQGVHLTSTLTSNESYLHDMLSSLAEGIDIAPKDALFQFENGKVVTFKPSSEGRQVNQEQTFQSIRNVINNIAVGKTNPSDTVIVNLTVETVLPTITTANSNTFGIKELLGVGTSKFAHSIAGRIHNVELAASRINGRLVKPGETFSFNDALGDVSASTGFAPAYIIKEGKTVLGDGGGVCQVSTTLFRAAMNSGLPIEERHAHAYRVGYYEQDSPPGLDATVFGPTVDLKFKNDTSSYLLIQSSVDTANLAMKFEIYGTTDGRKSEISKPVVLSQIAPPPDLYQDDPTLPSGTVKQVDFSAWGAKVVFDYKVTRNGEEIFKRTYTSNYQPWQAIFLKGTKT